MVALASRRLYACHQRINVDLVAALAESGPSPLHALLAVHSLKPTTKRQMLSVGFYWLPWMLQPNDDCNSVADSDHQWG